MAGRLLCYVRGPDRDEGPILEATGAFEAEVANAGPELADHSIARAPRYGLMVFEGWVDVGPEPEPDVYLVGEWRTLTFWELCRLREGDPVFGPDAAIPDAAIKESKESHA